MLRLIIMLALNAIFWLETAAQAVPAPVYPLPSEAQLAWHEMEMNAFIHFTINTFTDKEWGYGNESPALFNPSSADPGQWAKALKDAGFRGLILTCKHHDGFCLWPSGFTTHSVKNSPWKNGKGDIVRETRDAAAKQGLKFGIYLSPWDRNRADYGSPAYISYYRQQLQELFTSYGPVFEMWFDGANGGDGFYGGANEKRKINGATYYDWPGTIEQVRRVSPDVIFFSDAGPGVRWVGNEKGLAGETNWNTISTDTLFAGKAGIEGLLNTGSPDGDKWVPAEVDVSIRPGWFYHQREDSLVKTAEELFSIYLSSVGRGSVLLLNVPPDRRGLLHENDLYTLRGFRTLLDREFGHNLAAGATIKATQVRKGYAAGNMIDGKKETFWATNDTVKTAVIELWFPKPQRVKYILLQEYIRLGQRVSAFTVEYLVDGVWKAAASGTTIGYKRILELRPATATAVRVSIDQSKAGPLISNLEIY
ncbi:MAG: glycoside hydrolase family 29 [Chitinophagaceae bacterium]|nr:MAG: glycoside hydrolase family 29 [Chitinophagaceae bacterium]